MKFAPFRANRFRKGQSRRDLQESLQKRRCGDISLAAIGNTLVHRQLLRPHQPRPEILFRALCESWVAVATYLAYPLVEGREAYLRSRISRNIQVNQA